MPYLICERCKGFYELQEGESKADFQSCQCGGNLFYSDELENYTEPQEAIESFTDDGGHIEVLTDEEYIETEYSDDEYDEPEYSDDEYYANEYVRDNYKHPVNSKSVFVFILIIFLVVISAAFFSINLSINNKSSDASVMASDSHGYVQKYVYSSSPENINTKKIAIVTGIHPREKLSKEVWTDLLKNYRVPSNWEIVQYNINVVDQPDDYVIGRTNGENLAANYILPDLLKSEFELLIVCHDHQPGYGEGFYIATPKMDARSVTFAESLNQSLSGFNYYKNNGNSEPATSNSKFTNPIASNGDSVFVYEMPGLTNYSESYSKTKELLSMCFQLLKNQ